jgi:hypothetical protein
MTNGVEMSDWLKDYYAKVRAKNPVYFDYTHVNPSTGHIYARPDQAMALSYFVTRWRETRKFRFMLDAIEYCELNNLQILPVLRKHMADAARAERKDGPTKAMSESLKEEAFRVMANLIIHGASLAEAAGKVAAAAEGRWKASTLETDYPKVWRSGTPSTEDSLREYYQDDPNPEFSKMWQQIRIELREPTDDERGERR